MTPWDPQEMYPMLVTALQKRPAVIAPFVTRPNEKIFDRAALGLPPATEAINGVSAMRRADRTKKPYHGTLVLQGSRIINTFVEEVLPRIIKSDLNMNIFYVASTELFDMLPVEKQREIYPEECALEAMGMTGLTLPTMVRWVTSEEGRRRTVHAFRKGQWKAVKEYADWMTGK